MTDHTQAKPDDWDEERDGTWDGNAHEATDRDLELITSYLNGHLDPERIEAVRKRLEEDEDFRDLAEPLLLMWSVPKHIVRHPRPAGEWERDFAEFKRRTGFGQSPPAPPPSRWRRIRQWRGWKGLRVLTLLLVGAYMIGAQVMYSTLEDQMFQQPENRVYTPVAFDTGWIPIGDGIELQLMPDTWLGVDDRQLDGMKHVKLAGMARFRVNPIDPASRVLRTRALHVETTAGSVWAGEADFSVTARESTTAVFVHALGARRALMPGRRTVMASAAFPGEGVHIALFDLEGARLVRGRDPERVITQR